MTTGAHTSAPSLDFSAATRWPKRAAAHMLGVGLVAVVIAALPVAPTDLDRHQLPKESLAHVAVLLAFLLARPLPLRAVAPLLRGLLLALVLLAVLSAALATNPWLGWRAAAMIISGCAAYAVASDVAADGASAILLWWCCVAAVVGAGGGLAQAYGVTSPLFATTRVPGGTFGNRNFMAHFAAISLPLMIYVTLTARKRALTIMSLLAVATLLAAIVLTRSRAAWIASAVAAMIWCVVLLRAQRRHALPSVRRRARSLGSVALLGIVLAIALPNHLAWKSASPYTDTLAGLANHDEGSGHGRMLQYRNSVTLALRHPVLGVGPGNWPIRYGDVAPPSDPSWVRSDAVPLNPWPSSDWMALLSEVGFPATACALLAGIVLMIGAWRATRLHGDAILAGGALLALLAATFVAGNFDAVLLLPAPLLLVAIATAALQARGTMPDARHATQLRSPVATLSVALLLAIIALRSALQTTAYIVAGDGRSTAALAWAARIDPESFPLEIALAQRLPCQGARSHAAAAVRLAPHWPSALSAVRRCR